MTNSQTDSHTSSHIKIHTKRTQNAFSIFRSQFRFNIFSKMICFTFYQVTFFQNTLYMIKQLKPYFTLSHIKVKRKCSVHTLVGFKSNILHFKHHEFKHKVLQRTNDSSDVTFKTEKL